MVELDRLLDQYDRGLLNRRQLLKGLAVAIGGSLAGDIGPGSVQAQGVPIVPRAHRSVGCRAIGRVLCHGVRRAAANGQSSEPDNELPRGHEHYRLWISLSRHDNPARPAYDDHVPGPPGVYSHLGLGVKETSAADFARIAAEVKERFPNVKSPNTPTVHVPTPNVPEIYLFDPDGTPVQLIAVDHNGYLGPDRL